MADTPVTPTPIGAFPTAPARTDPPATFVTRADAWVAAVPTRSAEMNALATNVNFNANSAFASAGEAAADAATASAAATSATSTANATLWVSGTTYALTDSAISPIDFKTYRRKIAGAGTTDPSADATNWEPLSPVLAGGMTLLSTVTASTSATVDLETTFDSTYDNYMIVASGVRPVANNASLRAQLKIGGSYIATSSYAYRADAGDSTADTLFVSRSIGDSSFNLANRGIGSGASDGCDVVMFVFEANSTTLKKRIKFSSDYSSSGTLSGDVGRGHNSGTAALTGVRFLMNSGNIATGTFRLYGIANS